MMLHAFLRRFSAIFFKEFKQMKRDKVAFLTMIGIPVLEIILFGFVVNIDPLNSPTAVVDADKSIFSRTVIRDLQNTGYFKILNSDTDARKADWLLRTGRARYIVYFPQGFSKRIVHGDKPQLLIEADATDPAASGNAIAAFENVNKIIARNYKGSLGYLATADPPVDVVVHLRYNPERITQYNIVPGLLGVVLSMTMVMFTALAITRERESGTMEGLLSMPVRPLEVILGKLTPYIIVGYIQVIIILIMAKMIFSVPFNGSLTLLLVSCMPFIIASLAVGITFSTIATNQLQALESSFFYFLPSMLLSGFMFPFYGMPGWAQVIGNCLPLTHFLVIVRGIMLKGNGIMEILPSILAIFVFTFVTLMIALKRYRQTLD